MSAWFRAARAISLTAVLAPCLGVLLLGRGQGLTLDVWRTVAALLGVSALLLGVNLQNDVEDDARGIDGPGSLGGSGVLQAGHLTAAQLQRAAFTLMAVGALLGLPTLLVAPLPVGVLGVVTVLGALGYSGKPFGLKYRALGDVSVMLLCGPLLTFGASMAMFGQAIDGVWALGVLFGCAATGILHVNNMQDVAVDARVGAKTVARLLGPSASKAYLVAVYLVAAAAWASLRLPLVPFAIGALGFIPAVVLSRRVVSAASLDAFPLLRVQAAQAHLAIGVAAAVGLFVKGVMS